MLARKVLESWTDLENNSLWEYYITVNKLLSSCYIILLYISLVASARNMLINTKELEYVNHNMPYSVGKIFDTHRTLKPTYRDPEMRTIVHL